MRQSEQTHAENRFDEYGLIRDAKQGSRPARNALVKKYYDFVLIQAKKFALRSCLFYEDEYDLAQNVFLRFDSIISNFEPSFSVSFEGFLLSCIYRIFNDSVKRKKAAEICLRSLSQADAKNKSGTTDFADAISATASVQDSISDQSLSHTFGQARISAEQIDVRKALIKIGIKKPLLAEVAIAYYFHDLDDPEIAGSSLLKEKNITRNHVWRLRQRALAEIKKTLSTF